MNTPGWRRRAARQTVFGVILPALVLTGCALFRSPPPATVFADVADRPVRFTQGFDADAERVSVVYRDPADYEAYLAIHGATAEQARAEMVYLVANGRQTALEFAHYDLAGLNMGWRFNARPAVQTSAAVSLLRREPGALRYQRYRHTGGAGERGCVSFVGTWDTVAEDPLHRPGRALFGYYCSAIGQPLDDAAARDVLGSLAITDDTPERTYFGDVLTRDPAALARARGIGPGVPGSAGRADFPLHYSRYYTVGGTGDALY
ncbi:hypothetical protein [Salinisphaera sp. T31B1]|uniref:hypothetical protein n=1 Tax=Salinisphaera sp. T31B1 TaxID=727963 RepID=UPI0033410C45